MCVHLQAVLETVPAKKGGLTEDTKKVFVAFSKDITDMDKRIQMLNEELQEVKKDVSEVKINLSNVDGKIDTIKELIEKRLNSNVDEERLIGAVTNRIFRSKKVWILLLVITSLFILSGVAITYIVNNPIASSNIATIASSIK